jgi:predicted dehydrogenase
VAAARKYGRIVQTGMEARASDGLQQAFESIRAGSVGQIRYAHVVLYRERKSIGKTTAPTPVPPTVDYNLWCGPAPVAPLMRKYLHYDWHWTWAYGSGEMGNNGVHYLDMCRWALGLNKPPRRAMSVGGRFSFDDDGETPNTQVALLDFESVPVICEIRGLPERTKGGFRTVDRGIIIQGEGGHFAGSFDGGTLFDGDGRKIKEIKGADFHRIQVSILANFVEAIRSRSAADLRAEALQGHLSAACCHMANVSYRLGAQAAPEAMLERMRTNHDLTDAFERCREHLRINGVDLNVTRGVLGPWVTLDADKEQFVGELADQANSLATREYRKPFVVPTIS